MWIWDQAQVLSFGLQEYVQMIWWVDAAEKKKTLSLSGTSADTSDDEEEALSPVAQQWKCYSKVLKSWESSWFFGGDSHEPYMNHIFGHVLGIIHS